MNVLADVEDTRRLEAFREEAHAWIKANFPERYNAGPDAILNPDDIADVYWQLHQQKRSAWTFEMDLRPWKETW